MKALVLAAGRSARLWPLSEKNLISFRGVPLLIHQLENLRSIGIQESAIVVSPENYTEIKTLAPEYPLFIQERASESMAGAVLAARSFLTGPTLIISNNDLFDPTTFTDVISHPTADGVLLVKQVSTYFPGGYVVTDGDRITSIREKPGQGNEPSDMVTIVCHYFKHPQDFVAAIEAQDLTQGDGYERALTSLFSTHTFVPCVLTSAWHALKYPWQILDSMQFFLRNLPKGQHIADTAEVADTARLIGNVTLAPRARIMEYAVIRGPAYIGEGALVGNFSLVRESMIEASAVVGSSSEVARSYVGRSSWLHRNYVGDSILGDNVSLGSGAVTGNLRLDEQEISVMRAGTKTPTGRNKFGVAIGQGSRIGINASIAPGTLIGKNCFVPGSFAGTLPDTSFVHPSGDIRPNHFSVSERASLI